MLVNGRQRSLSTAATDAVKGSPLMLANGREADPPNGRRLTPATAANYACNGRRLTLSTAAH